MRVSRLAFTAMAAVACLVLAAAAAALLRHPAAAAPTLVGERAPEISLATADGRRLSLSDFAGHPVVLNFWASWCSSCRSEVDLLNASARAGSGGAQFLGVDIQDSAGAAAAFEAAHAHAYPVGPGSAGGYLRFGVSAPPETFFVDPGGVVVAHVVGPLSQGSLAGGLARAAR